MNPNLKLEQLAETFRNLSSEEREKLRSLIGEEWFEPISGKQRETISSLLEESERQHLIGNFKNFENVIQESRKKYGN